MEQEEISALTNNVFLFKEALKRLTDICIPAEQDVQKYGTAHERLSNVLRILKNILSTYPELQSTEILLKTQNLILHIQDFDPDDNEKNKELYEYVSQLATAFSVRISDYLMVYSDTSFSQSFLESSDSRNESEQKKKITENSKLYPGMKIMTTTFGVDLDQHLFKTGNSIPTIVCKCVEEIEKRGLLVKGIYRVSGVKSRVEKLCQEFELGGESVDLTDIHPHIIANVLKLYLRQLPQPLFTFKLYPQFMKFSKDWVCSSKSQPENAVIELKKIIEKLPKNYYFTVNTLFRHLKRVSREEEVNNMSPSNLGIVFGPTLMRNTEDQSCMFSLLDAEYQTRVVELVISWADKIFPT
uniref:Rho-GAP domain-containing protein n=1 Tax=Clastoptera arizonana TaxID=38151 RepID=A0A1B6D371_9HEMI